MKTKCLVLSIVTFLLASIPLLSGEQMTNEIKKAGFTIFMDSRKDTLTIVENDENSSGNKFERIMFNDQDYTKYAAELLRSYPMSFASSKLVIFGNEGATLINDEWKCPKGIIFIPGEKEIMIAHASDIIFNEKTQTVDAKEVSIVKSCLGNKEKEEKKLDHWTLDLTGKEKCH